MSQLLSITFDFKIVGSNISGISQIIPQHEDALNYLTEEVQYTVFKDGSAALWDESVGDFVSDAGHAHLCCELVWVTAFSRLAAAFSLYVLSII